ncbi:MAG: hypothetical protein MZW92_15170 [Comamonadaceae bacterium]|nr:hypothetical protein [Comamonadaceae bacterium]
MAELGTALMLMAREERAAAAARPASPPRWSRRRWKSIATCCATRPVATGRAHRPGARTAGGPQPGLRPGQPTSSATPSPTPMPGSVRILQDERQAR